MDSLKLAYDLTIPTAGALKVDLEDYMKTTRLVSVGVNAADIFNEENTYFSWYTSDISTIFENSWIQLVQNMIPSFYIAWCAIVYRKAIYNNRIESTAHIDCNPVDKNFFYYGLNFTLQEDDSEMVWYERKDGRFDFDDSSTYFDINHTELNEIYRHHVSHDRLTLVNTSVIHDVDSKASDRWAISLRGMDQNEYGSWENTVKFFEPWIYK